MSDVSRKRDRDFALNVTDEVSLIFTHAASPHRSRFGEITGHVPRNAQKSDHASVIGLSFNVEKDQFEDSNGNRIQNSDLELVAEASREKYSELGQLQEVGGTQPYGMATLKRYALVSTLLRQADAGGREAFLRRMDAKLQSSGKSFDPTP